MPFFSIVIPVYNRVDILPETLLSIKEQTYSDWECIVVDDGSTDGTKEYMEMESNLDSRFRYIYQVNAERSVARNNGSKNAKGEYICFLDSDDKYVETYLQILYDEIVKSNHSKALFITDFCTWDENSVQIVEVPSFKEPIADWLFHYPVSPSRTCVHTAILKKYQFREDIVIVEDTVLWVSIAKEFPVKQIKTPLIWYRMHEGNSVNKGTKSAFSRAEGMMKFFSEELSSIVSKKVKNEMMSDVRFRMAEYHQLKGSHMKAIFSTVHSILIQPSNYQTKSKFFFIFQYIPGFSLLWRYCFRKI
jgi:glycosyltransferase involved in cell wall biosynthesis